MQRIETPLPGVLELAQTVFHDARGIFFETYNFARFCELGITDTFVQDNHSCSRKGTLRGLRYQLRHPQAKLCRVVEGQAIDVELDVREGSAYFGKWTIVVFSAEDHNQIYVPTGFAHGFLAFSDKVQFLFKCSDFYDPQDEYGVLWRDHELNIRWDSGSPVVSERDSKLRTLAAIPRECLQRYREQ